MATITSRQGRWQARVRTKGLAPATKTFHLRADAVRWAKDVEIQQQRGTYQSPSVLVAKVDSLDALLARYTKSVVPTKRSGDKEAFLIARMRADLPDLFGRPACEIRPADVASVRDAWLADGYAPASVVRRLALISHCYETAAKEWGVPGLTNPVRAIRLPKLMNARSRLLSEDEISRIISASESAQLPALVLLLRDTAMRRSEAIGLELHRVDFERRVARLDITKNGRPREVALSPRAAALLRSLPVNTKGRFFTFSPTSASWAWRRAVTRAHECYLDECSCFGRTVDPRFLVDANMHDLRHTRLTELGRAGLSTVELMAVSGHVTLSQLARYVHVQSAHIVAKLATIEERQVAEALEAAPTIATAALQAT